MNKRISKKLHKKYLVDVVYQISISSSWRKVLFENEEEKEFLISKFCEIELPKLIAKQIRKYNLRYIVYREITQNEDENLYNMKRFVFKADNFSRIYSDSYNNSDVV